MKTRALSAGPACHTAGLLLLHPACLGAIALLVLNDHWLKARWPGAATGKASDLAGVFLLPVVVVGAVDLLRLRRIETRVVIAAILVTCIGFSLVKLWRLAAVAYGTGVGLVRWMFLFLPHVLRSSSIGSPHRVVILTDPTDLAVLPIAAIGWWVLGRRWFARTARDPLALITSDSTVIGFSTAVGFSGVARDQPHYGS
jgi:hypothetical protein